MNLNVDVLVIGAGPSGSTAAKHAARDGARTLLIEKRTEIGSPVRCGEGMSKGSLDEIGISPNRTFIANEVQGARIIAPDGTFLVVGERLMGSETGYVIDRDRFDRHLATEAARAGAEIMIKTTAVGLLHEGRRVVGARCEHLGNTFDVSAKVVIGADGFRSQVGRWAGLETRLRPRDMDASLQYRMVGVEGDARRNDFYLGSCAPGGYAWTIWKGADIANVGICVNLSKVRDKGEAKQFLDGHIARVPELAKGQLIEEAAGTVSVSMPLERTVAPGILLVGDAARLTDPLPGSGIRNGCLSGMLAGQVAARAVREADGALNSLKPYETRWRAKLEEDLVHHYLIKERLLRVDDRTIGTILRAIAQANLSKLDVESVLAAIQARDPEALKDIP